MHTFKSLHDIVSNNEEYDQLYNTDHLFIIKGKRLDDDNLMDVVRSLDHYEWFNKLRGPAEGPAKLHNLQNTHDWMHGYVIAVSQNKLTAFEQSALMIGIKHGYTFEKLDLFQTKKEIKEELFHSLFTEE
jgi:hypothetical protein